MRATDVVVIEVVGVVRSRVLIGKMNGRSSNTWKLNRVKERSADYTLSWMIAAEMYFVAGSL